jgi:hypothetical protein
MFLQKVYRHSKWLFCLFVAFIIGQLFINFKHGMVASPFLHYGMYSEPMKVNDSYGVFEVYVDGKMLQGKDFSPQQWDKIIVPLRYFANLKHRSNELYYTDIQRLMKAVKLAPDQQHYLQQCNAEEFRQWYIRYLETVIDKPIHQLDTRYRIYRYNNTSLQPTDAILSLEQLCN